MVSECNITVMHGRPWGEPSTSDFQFISGEWRMVHP